MSLKWLNLINPKIRLGGSYNLATVSHGGGGYGGYASYECPQPAAAAITGILSPNLLLILAAGAGALGLRTIQTLEIAP